VANLSQQFYNLDTDPFRLSPDHHFSFPHGTYKKGLADLKLALLGEAGLIAITGRPGTGKTTLVNEAIAQLDVNTFVVATLITTRFEAHDLWSMVASSFGQNCNNKSSSDILLELEDFLRMKHSGGKRALLIVDEAQGLGDDVLDELQLLSKLQDDGKPLLQVILIGPEELEDAINSPEREDSGKPAISASQLGPLTESEIIDYITHRLNHAGWKGDPAISKGACCLVHHFSSGNPRVINRICSRFLLYGCAEKKHELNADDMKLVLEELSDEHLVSKNIVVPSDVAERVNTLEYEYIKPPIRINKTSIQTLHSQDDPVIQPDKRHEQAVNVDRHIDDLLSSQDLDAANEPSGPTGHPGVSINQATIETDEDTDNASVESNDESQTRIEAAADNPPASQAPDDRKGSRWPDKSFWMAVSIAIAIVVGLKFYFEAPQDPAQIQSQADTGSRSSAPLIQLAENTQHTDLPANKPETATSTRQTPAMEAAKPVKPQQTKTDKIATDTAPEPKEITPESIPVRAEKTAPPVITRSADPTGGKPPAAETKMATAAPEVSAEPIGLFLPAAPEELTQPDKAEPADPTREKSPVAETKTVTVPAPPSPKTTAVPDIPAEPKEPLLPAASVEPVAPDNTDAPATDRSITEPVKQASKAPARPSPEVKETTGTPTVAKKDPVFIKPEKSPRPVKKKPEKSRVTRNTTKTARSASLTMDSLLARQWITGSRQQASHLPSFITSCSSTSRGGECWSGEYTTEISGESARVKTKSYIKGFTKSGFTIKYKNMLLGGTNEKRHWENKTHQLDCKIISRDKIKCKEVGANRAITFTQSTSN
jgi:type II secretory pathway predicted ATPase ExeA